MEMIVLENSLVDFLGIRSLGTIVTKVRKDCSEIFVNIVTKNDTSSSFSTIRNVSRSYPLEFFFVALIINPA